MVRKAFSEAFPEGHKFEDQFAKTLRDFGCDTDIPGKILEEGKGPRLCYRDSDGNEHCYIAPDLYVAQNMDKKALSFLPREMYIDTKLKGRFTYYRINEAWQSGINRNCYEDYLKVENASGLPVFVLHASMGTSDMEMDEQQVPDDRRPAPYGIYIHRVTMKIAFSRGYDRGMVYWAISDMQRIGNVAMSVGNDTDEKEVQ